MNFSMVYYNMYLTILIANIEEMIFQNQSSLLKRVEFSCRKGEGNLANKHVVSSDTLRKYDFTP